MLTELRDLTVDYAKQETLEPLKGLGRFLIWGVAGSFCIAMGLLLWVIGALRAMQTETGSHFTNHLSWVPYVVTLAACAAVTALSAFAITKDWRAAQKRKAERKTEAAS